MKKQILKNGLKIYPSGIVKREKDNVVVSTKTCKYTGEVILFSKTEKSNSHYLAEIIAEVFVDNPHGYKFFHHKDGNKKNNSYSNLEWVEAPPECEVVAFKDITIASNGYAVFKNNRLRVYHTGGVPTYKTSPWKTHKVSTLVADAFLQGKYREKVNFRDGNENNFHLDNLYLSLKDKTQKLVRKGEQKTWKIAVLRQIGKADRFAVHTFFEKIEANSTSKMEYIKITQKIEAGELITGLPFILTEKAGQILQNNSKVI